MDEMLDSFVKRILEKVKKGLMEVIDYMNMEEVMPLQLNTKQCMKLLGVSKHSEFVAITKLSDFPVIDRGKGAHLKFPRDAVKLWYNENWQKLADIIVLD